MLTQGTGSGPSGGGGLDDIIRSAMGIFISDDGRQRDFIPDIDLPGEPGSLGQQLRGTSGGWGFPAPDDPRWARHLGDHLGDFEPTVDPNSANFNGGLADIIAAASQMAADAQNMPNTYQWGRRAIDWTGVPDEEGVSGGFYPQDDPIASGSITRDDLKADIEEAIRGSMGEPEFEPGPWDYHPNMSALRADPGRPSTWEEREPGLGRGPEESLWDLYQRKQAELHNPSAPPAADIAHQAALWQGIQLDPNAAVDFGLYNPGNWAPAAEDLAQAYNAPAPEEWGAAGSMVFALLDLLPYAMAGA